jgi:hypothetical protein
MKLLGTLVASSLLMALLVGAAESQPTIAERSEIPPGPATKLEALAATSGAALIRQYTEVGLIAGGAISVAAIIVTNAANQTETKGLIVSPSEVTRGTRHAYVDYDEIPGLLSGIEYIANVDLATLKLANFAATYQTRGNFSVTAYNDGESKKAFVSIGRLSANNQPFDVQDLARLREMITAAKKILDNPDAPEAKGSQQVPEIAVKPETVEPESVAPAQAAPQARPKARAKGKAKAKAKAKAEPKTKSKAKARAKTNN